MPPHPYIAKNGSHDDPSPARARHAPGPRILDVHTMVTSGGPGGTSSLSPSQVAAFAHASSDQRSHVDLGPDALDRVAEGHAALLAARTRGAVYGLTTGVGALRHVSVDTAHADAEPGTADHALRLWRSHAAGLGPELDDGTARATMLIRLNQLLHGGSGVQPALVRALADAVDSGAVPRLHAYGAVGTGDLAVLAELGLTLAGELPWRSGDGSALTVADGDALPFISSNAMTAAVGALAVTRLAALARAAESVAALSHLALRGAGQTYDPRVHAARDDPAQQRVAARMHDLLGPDREPGRLQDPFCLRALPQVHGPLADALEAADRALTAEIGAAAENPLAVDGTALHHGQFLTQRIAAALDGVRAATYPLLSLSTARTSAMMNPALTGLPAFLADGPAGSSGLMIVEYVAQDVLARSRAHAGAVTAAQAVVSLGLEEHASFSTQAAWSCRELAGLVPDLLACELVCAVRVIRASPDRIAGAPARAIYDRAAAALPDEPGDHVLGPDLRAAAALVAELAD